MKPTLGRLLAAATMTVLASGAAVAAEKGVIKIVSQSPLSGPQSVGGEGIKLGAELAVQDFGALITDLGFQLVFQPEDDQATPNVGVANANRIINDPEVLGIVGHYNSGVAIPASEVYVKDSLVMVSPANTNPVVTTRDTTKAIANRICGRDDVQGPAGAAFAVETLKVTKIYVINDKTAYGSGLASAFEEAAKAAGVEVVLSTGVDEKETDFSSILNRARIDKPDLVYYGGMFPQGGLLIKQMRQKGLTSAFLGGDGLDSGELQNIAGADNMKDVYFTTTGVPISELPAAAAFAKAYQEKFGKSPEGYSAYAYDSARIVIEAIAASIKAKGGEKPTRAEVAAAVRATELEGITGKVKFNANGDIVTANYVVVSVGATPAENKTVKVVAIDAPL
ncbi:branched-chain amino acid ABC transporter substrate-binding protein [Chthonobacter albigriseus]|uniref:branched-chain amino acid ABC transporter substrate-binding protein n=1 Tax=Chthonobacter albigriseus TaxID=1683161 RepID=UPI0015EF14FF|nr:branched-chain amino acid ABC transporter substrate-binding protein [Chthonobacter albigriseus]